MQDKYIQGLRYKLQKRVRRVNSAQTHQFASALKHLFQFIDSMPMLAAVRDDLITRTALLNIENTVTQLVQGEPLDGETEEESAAIGYLLLKTFLADPEKTSLVDIAFRRRAASDIPEAIEFARVQYLEPFYEYLDEHIDDQQAILYFLKKYKHRCEWFDADRLRTLLLTDTQIGEKVLASDLYRFLHDEGIAFHIEPESASGIADFVAEQVGDDRVVADAKLFWPEKGKAKSYIVSAFHQAYTYARDYNEPCAYLVVFKMCKEDIRFMVPVSDAMFPCLSHNNKTIYFVVIDLCDHGAPASKRGALRCIEVTADELVQVEDH